MSHNFKVGQIWRAKRPQAVGIFTPVWNDRQLIYVSPSEVQYDSPSVKNGSKYPKVSIEKFLKWAGKDVTAETPKGDWNTATS